MAQKQNDWRVEKAQQIVDTLNGCFNAECVQKDIDRVMQILSAPINSLPDTLMNGAVTVERPKDLRNRIGLFLFEKGCKMGQNVDIGKVQDWLEEFMLKDVIEPLSTELAQDAMEDPIGNHERDKQGLYRIGKGVIDRILRR